MKLNLKKSCVKPTEIKEVVNDIVFYDYNKKIYIKIDNKIFIIKNKIDEIEDFITFFKKLEYEINGIDFNKILKIDLCKMKFD